MDGGAGKTELMMMMRSCNFQEKKKQQKKKETEFTWLPWDLVLLISRYVVSPRDRLSFRSVNRLLRSEIPSSLTDFFLKKEEQAAAACFSDDHHHHPWLIRHESCNHYRMMLMKEEYHAYTLLDPWHGVGEKYFLNLPGSSSSYAAAAGGSIIYCNENWCVIVQPMTTSIFLWNPFTKEKITITLPYDDHLPNQQLLKSISACSFLNSPHSPHFQLFLLCVFSRHNVSILIFENNKWRICFMCKYAFRAPPSSYSQFCLLNGQADFYLVDTENGRVWHLDRSNREEKCPKFPNLPDYSRSYLVKCEEDLLAVVIDVEEDDVHVFKLQSNSNWVAVNNLDEFVLYISHYSSFSRRVTVPGEGNRIYFPRFDYDGKLLYYSLHSKRYHHHHHHSVGGGDHQPVSAAGFIQQVTRNQIVYNAWIQPRWC